MTRKLASIQKIESFTPIEGKDRIVIATFVGLGWQAIVNKNDFKVGDLCVFIEPDSLLPKDDPTFAFMEKNKWRVRTIKMSGVTSQGLVMPISILPDGMKYKRGKDVTELLKITKAPEEVDEDYVPKKKYPKWLMKHKWFRDLIHWWEMKKRTEDFPHEVARTDETRIQNAPQLARASASWIATEKVDGTSSTYLLRRIRPKKKWDKEKWDFAVCSHNRRLYDKSDMPVIWRNAEKYRIKDKLQMLLLAEYPDDDWICIQGETISSKIQGNPYKLQGGKHDLYVFNLITESQGRLDTGTAKTIIEAIDMKFVPIIKWFVDLKGMTAQEILDMANGMSLINPDCPREGIVFRGCDNAVKSFKAVSPKYLLKGKPIPEETTDAAV